MNRFIISVLFIAGCISLNAQSTKIMLVTGGHSYDTIPFFKMFDSMKGLEFEYISQPLANQKIAASDAEQYDLLVFYDISRKISDEEKKGYLNLLNKGKPMLFLHHSLLSYAMWPEFEKIIGGKYLEKGTNSSLPDSLFSRCHYNVSYNVKVADANHPATKGISGFLLFDEAFENYRIDGCVIPLYTNDYKNNETIIGWENKYQNSKIIYLQPGHDRNAFDDKNFRRVLLQLIKYLTNN